MKEFVFNIIVGLIFIVIAAGLSVWTNKIKSDKCIAAGGQVILNITDANMSTCIISK